MEKKLYNTPQMEVTYLKTADLLRPTDASGVMPTPPGGAPSRGDIIP